MKDRHLKNLFNRHYKHLRANPHIVPRLVRNYFKLLVLKRPVLRKVEFALTYGCAGRCQHCSAELLRRSPGEELDFATIDRTVEQAVGIGAIDIHFTGGEALFHGEIESILRATRHRGVITSVATGGVPLTAENVELMKRSGVSFVSVSLDSSRPEEHDRFRGRTGCFDAVISGTKRCLEAGLSVFLCTVVTKLNIISGDLMRIVEIADGLGVPLTLVLPCKAGRWNMENSVLLGEEELAEYHRILKHPSVRWEGESNYMIESCPAGREKIYITPYGDVLPCNFMHVSFGNVKHDRVDAIWRRMNSFEPITRRFGGCKAGADQDFIRDVIDPANKAQRMPIYYEEHPLWRGEDKRSPIEQPVATTDKRQRNP